MIKRLAVVGLLVLLERVGVPLPLAFGFVMASLSVLSASDKSMFLFAFLAGLVVDLVFVNKLGISSIMFLLGRGLLVYLNGKFSQKIPWVLVIVSFLVALVAELWAGFGLRIIYSVSTAVLAGVFYSIIVKRSWRGTEIFLDRFSG